MKKSNCISTGDISLSNNNIAGNGKMEVASIKNENPKTSLNDSILTVVPYIVHESSLAREERHVKRLIIALIVSIATLLITNIGWLAFLSQFEFEYENTEISADDGGNANYIGQDGDIYNGSYKG